MHREIKIGSRLIGDNHPVYIVAEIGINHNGEPATAKRLIDAAIFSGCDAVKFQKRTPDVCIPSEQRDLVRETPWGNMTYLEYRRRVEFGLEEYQAIQAYCREREIDWFASCWDSASVDFMEQFSPICYKVPSAAITDLELMKRIRATGRPVIMSTGMSTMAQIRAAAAALAADRLVLMHCTSTYPCDPAELNLRMIQTLRNEFTCPIGYSGHETGLATTVVAVALGACLVERHITLDRALWGSDQAASIEPQGMAHLVKYIRTTEAALGDGTKRVYESERIGLKRLRRVYELAADA